MFIIDVWVCVFIFMKVRFTYISSHLFQNAQNDMGCVQAGKKCLFPCKLPKISLQQGRFPSSVGWFPIWNLSFPLNHKISWHQASHLTYFFPGLLAIVWCIQQSLEFGQNGKFLFLYSVVLFPTLSDVKKHHRLIQKSRGIFLSTVDRMQAFFSENCSSVHPSPQFLLHRMGI